MSKKDYLHFWVFVFFLFVIALASSRPVWSAPAASTNTFHPTMDDSPYVTVYGSQTIQPWRYQLSSFFNYAKNPLEVGVGGVRQGSIIDHIFMGTFSGALGITDWFQVGLGVPVALYEDFSDPVTGLNEKSLRMSDIRLETKFRLVDIDRHSIGVSVLPLLTFPTGSGSRFVGNNVFTGGGKFIVDVDIKRRLQFSLNAGLIAREGVTVVNTLQDDQFVYGLGGNFKLLPRRLHLIAELYGATNIRNFFTRQTESPLEIDGGLRFFFPKPEGMALVVAGGGGLTLGYGSPTARVLVGLTYPNPRLVELPLPPPPPPPEEALVRIEKKAIVIGRQIHFEFNKAVIRPVSFEILDAVVALLKGHPDVRKVRIEGHTDGVGSDEDNMRLSQRRANAVAEYLISHGIEEGRLVAVGYGESRPIDTNETPEGRARNRRVEFIILEQEGTIPEVVPETPPQ